MQHAYVWPLLTWAEQWQPGRKSRRLVERSSRSTPGCSAILNDSFEATPQTQLLGRDGTPAAVLLDACPEQEVAMLARQVRIAQL